MRSAADEQAKTPVTAREFLEKCDAYRDDGGELHRVAAYFSSEHGQLRNMLDAYISTEWMDPVLKCELESFRFVMLDDTAAETPHRDISNEFKRASGSSIVAVASSLRMSQNLQLWDSFKDRTLLREKAWRNWKAVLTVQRAGKQMHTRLSKKRALDNIYRLNDLSLQDWTWLQPELKKTETQTCFSQFHANA